MSTTFYSDDRVAALIQVPYGSPERIPAEVVRVVSMPVWWLTLWQ